ncbi:MAG: hydantoinase/oxoprolinase family protein, partial [Pseudomonadota bacterium]
FALGEEHELVMIRAIVRARARAIAQEAIGQADATLEHAKVHDSRFYFEGEWYEAAIYDRAVLHAGMVVPGPAIIVEMDSTTLVLPGCEAEVDAIGNLLINPTGGAPQDAKAEG